MTRRSAMTLVEVLVAIFIMGIGLIALLTLFPIGILRMAQAIRDERTAQAGLNAHSLFIAQDIGNDPLVLTDGVIPDFFANPLPLPFAAADPFDESYAVLVDPIGYNGAPLGSVQDWVGGVPGYLRRRSTSLAVPSTLAGLFYRNTNFTLWDDISFNGVLDPSDPLLPPQGTPLTVGPIALPIVLRDTRFSWAYLLRRPQTSDRSIVDCSIIVFDQRSLAPTPGSLTLEEYVYPDQAFFNTNANTITIDYIANVPPPIRPGDWIMDATPKNASTLPGAAHSYFYRVVAGEELGTSTARYEVQNPIRGFDPKVSIPNYSVNGNSIDGYRGTAIIIRGIAEVFEKGPVRMP